MTFIQAGVLKCNAPPHPTPGFVALTLLKNGESVSQSGSADGSFGSEGPPTTQFEYRSQVPKKKTKKARNGRIKDRPNIDELVSGGNQDQFKVRVIERLHYLNS